MAVMIAAACTHCRACQPVCPMNAIYEAKPHFRVDPTACVECEGYYPELQCAAICPVEGAILNSRGEPCNPPGSLTGIPPGLQARIIHAAGSTPTPGAGQAPAFTFAPGNGGESFSITLESHHG